MYHNHFYTAASENEAKVFFGNVISAYKILVDENYFHLNDDEEMAAYPKDAVSFIRCTAGSGKIYTRIGSFVLNDGDCIFLKFHDIIKYKSVAHIWSYRWINFSPIGKLPHNRGKIIYKRQNESEEKSFEKILNAGNELKDKNLVNHFFFEYLYSVLYSGELANTRQSPPANRMVDDICSFITQKVFSKITVDTVSAFFNISPRRLHQIFTNELGISPKQYILKKKMEEGYRLLVETSMPINKISETLCFSSPYHFTNEFKKVFSQTPTQVRNLEQNEKRKAKKQDCNT